MSADDELQDSIPDGEIHAAVVATVDTDARTCQVTIAALDGGTYRHGPVRYLPAGPLTHPSRGDDAVVLEDASGGLWLASWVTSDLGDLPPQAPPDPPEDEEPPPPRMERGIVSAAGTKTAGGTGWSVTKTATGQYTITFSPTFGVAIAPQLTEIHDGTGQERNPRLGSVSATGASFTVQVVSDGSASYVDCAFSFFCLPAA